MKKLLMLVSLTFGICGTSMAGCDDCGTIGVGGIGGGPTVGGGGGGVLEGGLYVGTTKFRGTFFNGSTFTDWRYHTYTGSRAQCQQNVNLDLANNAVLVSACTRVQ